ncbi:MAG: polysaccharide biosynthesis C-terminal domain-containing protein, partial [Clostridia bacterium]|nr:polysaccharide biosynthesis C-terminal domain-containing protein [Clostridia bacterium]
MLTAFLRANGGVMAVRQKLDRYIGDRAFYRRLMHIAFPVMLQNGITNFVSLLDNIMVGAVGTEQMTGVSIVGQLLFVFYLCIFGGLSGAGIFTSQYYGRSDVEGVRSTFRYKCWLALIIFAGAMGIFVCFGDSLIALYLHEGGETGDIALTAEYGRRYLDVMLWGLLPFAMQQVYATTLRETGETMLPMKAGIVAILVNFCFNYILIFGHFGAPALGSVGAAIATVLSRYVECLIIMIWAHTHTDKAAFMRGIYSRLTVPLNLAKQISVKGLPLLVNEALWSSGMAAVTQCYSIFGLAVVAGLN